MAGANGPVREARSLPPCQVRQATAADQAKPGPLRPFVIFTTRRQTRTSTHPMVVARSLRACGKPPGEDGKAEMQLSGEAGLSVIGYPGFDADRGNAEARARTQFASRCQVALAYERVGREVPLCRESPDHGQGQEVSAAENFRGARLRADHGGKVLLPIAAGFHDMLDHRDGSGASSGQRRAS